MNTSKLMIYSVSRRTHEIGIRMALGANESNVFKLVTGRGIILALVGATAGLVGALLLPCLMSSLLYGVRPTDPLTFVSLLLIVMVIVASYSRPAGPRKSTPWGRSDMNEALSYQRSAGSHIRKGRRCR